MVKIKMSRFDDIELYLERIKKIALDKSIDWDCFNKKTILITGATGMIGKMLIDVLMYRNDNYEEKCRVIAVGRNESKARERLGDYFEREDFAFVECDISDGISINEKVDYLIHAASATHPLQYANDPVGAIMPNVVGLNNLLRLMAEQPGSRTLFLSSVEIYGENRGDIDEFKEDYLGFIDCNTLRAGYPESKRVGEALCQAYKGEYGVDFVILRLARVFGPTMLMADSKASSQFIKNALDNEDIVLKSNGEQEYSYLYVADAVRAILFALINGESGDAYNVASEAFNISLKDFANTCAKLVKRKVIIDLPSETEAKGFSRVKKALMSGKKLEKIGFRIDNKLDDCLTETLEILREIEKK